MRFIPCYPRRLLSAIQSLWSLWIHATGMREWRSLKQAADIITFALNFSFMHINTLGKPPGCIQGFFMCECHCRPVKSLFWNFFQVWRNSLYYFYDGFDGYHGNNLCLAGYAQYLKKLTGQRCNILFIKVRKKSVWKPVHQLQQISVAVHQTPFP